MTERYSNYDPELSDMMHLPERWLSLRIAVAARILLMLVNLPAQLAGSLRHGRAAIRVVLLRQMYFTGFEACSIIIAVAAILGIVVITQVVSLAGSSAALTGKILVWVVLRELAPLLTAIIVIARSGTAIATELGSMKINGEIDSLEMMGIPVERYLILPRILGVTASIAVLTVYFVLAASLAGFLAASLGWHIPFEPFIQGVLSAVGIKEIMVLFCKSVLFGLFISVVCCSYGMHVGHNPNEIPQAATRSVMISLFLVVALDGLITYLSSILAF